MNMSIRENIQQVRENIAAAALSAGRPVFKKSVLLVLCLLAALGLCGMATA